MLWQIVKFETYAHPLVLSICSKCVGWCLLRVRFDTVGVNVRVSPIVHRDAYMHSMRCGQLRVNTMCVDLLNHQVVLTVKLYHKPARDPFFQCSGWAYIYTPVKTTAVAVQDFCPKGEGEVLRSGLTLCGIMKKHV